MTFRTAAMLGLWAFVLAGCANLGPDSPDCGFDLEDVSVEIILELQAVPTAEVGACLWLPLGAAPAQTTGDQDAGASLVSR